MLEETFVECIGEMSADLASLDGDASFPLPEVTGGRGSVQDEEEASRIHDLELLAGVER